MEVSDVVRARWIGLLILGASFAVAVTALGTVAERVARSLG